MTKHGWGHTILSLVSINSILSTLGEELCRDRTGYRQVEQFNVHACSDCYVYLFRDTKELMKFQEYLILDNDTRFLPDPANETSLDEVCETLDATECTMWKQCCRAAQECCVQQREHDRKKGTLARYGLDDSSSLECPMTWDGYACWGQSKKGTDVELDCPQYIPHAMPSVQAKKTCLMNGTWYRDQQSQMEWTDYRKCLDLKYFRTGIYISLVFNTISLLLLVPAVCIFLNYRHLLVQHRVRLHINLFLSFILTAVIVIIWNIVVVLNRLDTTSNDSVMFKNPVYCKIIYAVTRYARTCNFVWMFFEGYYLHRLIVNAFQPPRSLVLWNIAGWGLPWIPVIAYCIIKVHTVDEGCWVRNLGWYEWLIYGPTILCLVVNLLFLSNIVRLLVTQIKAHAKEPNHFRRALRATIILTPLFGLQLIFIIYRPSDNSTFAKNYEILSYFINNSQGIFVAIILCFVNREVVASVRRSFHRFKHSSSRFKFGRSDKRISMSTHLPATHSYKHYHLQHLGHLNPHAKPNDPHAKPHAKPHVRLHNPPVKVYRNPDKCMVVVQHHGK